MIRKLLLSLVVIVSLSASARATDIFTFTSSPSSWIGQGQSLTVNSFSVSRTYALGAYTNSVHFYNAGGYGIDLVAPNYTVPTSGHYDAVRWPFMGDGAGMAFTGPGRANNTLTGAFDVYQADYNPDGSIRSFAVDFVQYDEGSLAAWNRGSIRYNSSVPIPAPEPTTSLLLAATTFLATQRRRAA